MSLLIVAAKKLDLEKLKLALKNNPSPEECYFALQHVVIETRQKIGGSLGTAVNESVDISDSLEMIDLLIANGANINEPRADNTVLNLALPGRNIFADRSDVVSPNLIKLIQHLLKCNASTFIDASVYQQVSAGQWKLVQKPVEETMFYYPDVLSLLIQARVSVVQKSLRTAGALSVSGLNKIVAEYVGNDIFQESHQKKRNQKIFNFFKNFYLNKHKSMFFKNPWDHMKKALEQGHINTLDAVKKYAEDNTSSKSYKYINHSEEFHDAMINENVVLPKMRLK